MDKKFDTIIKLVKLFDRLAMLALAVFIGYVACFYMHRHEIRHVCPGPVAPHVVQFR